jgi:RNA polymerase sigma-70 factor (ECF subfamily)
MGQRERRISIHSEFCPVAIASSGATDSKLRGDINLEFSDGQLVEEALRGSSVAFERLVARYERLVFKIAFSSTGKRESALDVMQNVFLKIHSNLASFRVEGNFKNWIARITMNESVNWARSQKRHRAEELDEAAPLSTQPDQEEMIQDRETWEKIKQSMKTLKPLYAAAVSLRYFEGLSTAEIAQTLGCKEGTVKSMIFRSLQELRIQMGVTKEAAS